MNLFIILLLFLSPIAFTLEMLPKNLIIIYYLNPITYMIESFRNILIFGKSIFDFNFLIFIILSIIFYVVGTIFLKKSKDYILENE
jgi:ABC-type polysaccharide/polyol phosphate export permease